MSDTLDEVVEVTSEDVGSINDLIDDTNNNPQPKVHHTNKAFVTAYMEIFRNEGTYKDLASKLDLKKDSVYSRANSLRKAGLSRLPKMKKPGRVTSEVNLEELEALL